MSKVEEATKLNNLSEKAGKLWDLIPQDGSFVTNLSLRNKLGEGFSTEDFWTYRKELVDKGLIQIGRGRGGTVARAEEYIEQPKVKLEGLAKRETDLHAELENCLRKNRVRDIEQRGGQAWVAVTGSPRKRKKKKYGAHWSRPDVTLVEVTKYRYVPQKDIIITTYEVKKYAPRMDNSWVFEAASHSKAAHYSYLVVETREPTTELPEELSADLRQFRVGFAWLYRNPNTKEWQYKEILEADRVTPLPYEESKLLEHFAALFKGADKAAFENAVGS
jgi:hypothetical protein